ncbi:MAG TPA: hypothetical protein VKV21_14005 [Solirubrobacteraceae bacterium]|nr:hypothetical protein [Solirubrobacteraceae bacterium]
MIQPARSEASTANLRLQRRPGRGAQLTERDLEILRMTARNGAVTADLIAHILFERPERGTYGYRAAYQRIHTLKEVGLLSSSKTFAHRPAAISVTPRGALLADVGVAAARIPDRELNHVLQLAWLNEWNARHIPGVEITFERQLFAERFRERDEDLRTAARPRCPDARYVIPGQGRDGRPLVVAVELDLTRKDRWTLQRLIRAYDRDLTIDQVWWYVTPGSVPRFQEIVRSLRVEHRVIVKPIPTFPVRQRPSPSQSRAGVPSAPADTEHTQPQPLRGAARRFGGRRLHLPAVVRVARATLPRPASPGPSLT